MDYSEEIVTLEEQQTIINWVNENQNVFIHNPLNGGNFMFIDLLKETTNDSNNKLINNKIVYDIFANIKNRIELLENLKDCKTFFDLGHFIYYMEPGTKLHRHKDDNDVDSYHIRFNVLIQNPESGGIPIYAGKKIKTKERCYVICRSGLDYHESTVINGNKSKILISFGYSINKDKIHLYSKIFKNKFVPKPPN